TARSTAEALARLSARAPDVLVSDLGMPTSDGYALIEEVRKQSDVPAIALSAFARSEDRVRALTAGFHSHVPKPVEPAELAAVIARLAGKTSKKPAAPRKPARKRRR